MIKIEDLKPEDVGRAVVYTATHGERETGTLSSWSETVIFVRFRGPNGEACWPKDLHWAVGSEVLKKECGSRCE